MAKGAELALALALDVGSEHHGWCLGDVSDHPPRIVEAGAVDHAAALRSLASARGAQDVHGWWWRLTVGPWQWDLRHPPILERFVYRGGRIDLSGARAIEAGGELAGAWCAAAGAGVVKTEYREVSRGLAGQVLKLSYLFAAMVEVYPAGGGGKRCPQIGTKKEPGPLHALDVRGMYSEGWEGKKDHHRAAFCALLWWAYGRRATALA